MKSFSHLSIIALLLLLICFTSAGISCAFADSALTLEESELTYTIGTDSNCYVYVDEGSAASWEVSDTSILKLTTSTSYYARYEIIGAGDCNVTAKDSAGNKASCLVHVLAPDLDVTPTKIDANITDESDYIYIESGYGITAKSSDENIVKVKSSSDYAITLEFINPGSAYIVVTDVTGKTINVEVNVADAKWELKESELSFEVTDNTEYITILNSLGESDYTISVSDESIFTAKYSYGDIDITPVKPGEATVTVTDRYGKSRSCKVTVKEASWELSKSEFEILLSSGTDYIDVNSYYYLETSDYTLTNSDNKVLIATYSSGDITIKPIYPGKSIVTLKDKYGKSRSCTVTVKADPLVLNTNAIEIKDSDDNYSGYVDIYSDSNGNNYVSSARSANTSIANVVVQKDEYGDYVARVTFVGAGETNVTVTDQYGQTVTVPVKLAQKYFDEVAYLPDLVSAYMSIITYGDNKIYNDCDIEANIWTVIKGKKYVAHPDSEGYYVISNIPLLDAGTKITVYLQKGEALTTEERKVEVKSGKGTKVSVENQTYTGKKLKPALVIKDGNRTLKKGTDYIVKYSNNKNVGKSKATITFKGNYKGVKSVTFKINPKITKVSSVTGKKKAILVKWKKQTKQTTGYEIQYSTSKKFKTGNKKVTIKSNKTVKTTIKKLKAKKTYYLRIRTFKTVNGKKYYSEWSAAKSVKTK